MSPNVRIFLNIVATYGRSLYALVCGLFISRWVLATLGKTDFGLYGVVGGMMVIALLAFTMRLVRGRNAMVSLSMGSDPMEVRDYYKTPSSSTLRKGLELLGWERMKGCNSFR